MKYFIWSFILLAINRTIAHADSSQALELRKTNNDTECAACPAQQLSQSQINQAFGNAFQNSEIYGLEFSKDGGKIRWFENEVEREGIYFLQACFCIHLPAPEFDACSLWNQYDGLPDEALMRLDIRNVDQLVSDYLSVTPYTFNKFDNVVYKANTKNLKTAINELNNAMDDRFYVHSLSYAGKTYQIQTLASMFGLPDFDNLFVAFSIRTNLCPQIGHLAIYDLTTNQEVQLECACFKSNKKTSSAIGGIGDQDHVIENVHLTSGISSYNKLHMQETNHEDDDISLKSIPSTARPMKAEYNQQEDNQAGVLIRDSQVLIDDKSRCFNMNDEFSNQQLVHGARNHSRRSSVASNYTISDEIVALEDEQEMVQNSNLNDRRGSTVHGGVAYRNSSPVHSNHDSLIPIALIPNNSNENDNLSSYRFPTDDDPMSASQTDINIMNSSFNNASITSLGGTVRRRSVTFRDGTSPGFAPNQETEQSRAALTDNHEYSIMHNSNNVPSAALLEAQAAVRDADLKQSYDADFSEVKTSNMVLTAPSANTSRRSSISSSVDSKNALSIDGGNALATITPRVNDQPALIPFVNTLNISASNTSNPKNSSANNMLGIKRGSAIIVNDNDDAEISPTSLSTTLSAGSNNSSMLLAGASRSLTRTDNIFSSRRSSGPIDKLISSSMQNSRALKPAQSASIFSPEEQKNIAAAYEED